MNAWCPFISGINLHVHGRITSEDAVRQTRTAQEILNRFNNRPGVILADEVGMGKTFVSLAVAASVALQDPERLPVVVMIPSGLKEKWPRDFDTFKEKCLSPLLHARFKCGSAETGVDFLKFLDDPVETRRQIIFLTHGAMQRALSDPWVRLAVIRKAIYRRRGTDDMKRSLARCLGQLIRGLGQVDRHHQEVWEPLLSSHTEEWPRILRRAGYELADGDNPVPKHLVEALEKISTDEVYEALFSIPLRASSTYNDRVVVARGKINEAINGLWIECVRGMHLRLPLLILDEAHHLKNARTRLATLFQADADGSESQAIRPKGSMGGVFERMLFLTATPFQLGHHELCSVIERFEGIDWKCSRAPLASRDSYRAEVRELRVKLDRAQAMALVLSETWGRLTPSDLIADGIALPDADTWWQRAKQNSTTTGLGQQIIDTVRRTKDAFGMAGDALRPWVIRHLRSKVITAKNIETVPRRRALPGSAILRDEDEASHGLPIREQALLPFLLAARATLCHPEKRPVFAEGLASSYESFLHTRETPTDSLDEDDEGTNGDGPARGRAEWYLEQLVKNLPLQTHHDSAAHPKIAATTARVVEAWKAGEKVVVFCHFVRTGYALRRAISGRIRDTIAAEAGIKLGLPPEAAFSYLEDIGLRFFDGDSKARQEIEDQVNRLLAPHPVLAPQAETIQGVVRRFLRTPSFLDEKADPNERLMPNVRLVNGRTRQETRQRLMLTFNSPFFPEILIASAVMAEGVDLHRYCRYVIHHDLCWNPSTLEQRTGRIDRIGAKVETSGRSIHLYKPFLAATQDERQYQVVSDRERWFNIVMGAEYADDVASTEKQATRIRLASAISEELAFRLEVASETGAPLVL